MRFLAAVLALAVASCSYSVTAPPDSGPSITPPPLPDVPDTGFHLPLVSLGGFSYTVSLEAGLEYFAEIVDTGSSTTGIAADKCTNCGVMPTYTPGATASDTHTPACTTYADGSSWSGEVYKDQSWLRGPFVDLQFVAISSQQDFFDPSGGYQGIIGLGPKELLETGTSSYMDGLAAEYSGNELMAFRLCPDFGDLWLEGYDPKAAASDVQFTPMLPIDANANPFYSVQISDFAFGGTSLGLTTASFGPVLVDTGTSISYVPTAAENAMLAAINNNSAFKALFPGATLADTATGDCVTNASVTADMVNAMLPAFSVEFPAAGGGTFSVPVVPTLSYLYDAGGGQFCWAFSSSGTDPAQDGSLIGDTLLAGMLTVFDVQHLQMGFAPQAGCTPMTSMRMHAVPPHPTAPWYTTSPYFRPRPVRPLR